MSLKDKWAAKKGFDTETFEMDGETVEIRELSGLEKANMDSIEDIVEKSYFIWKTCVLNESLKLSRTEFWHAFDHSHNEVDSIIARVIKLSTGKAEKN